MDTEGDCREGTEWQVPALLRSWLPAPPVDGSRNEQGLGLTLLPECVTAVLHPGPCPLPEEKVGEEFLLYLTCVLVELDVLSTAGSHCLSTPGADCAGPGGRDTTCGPVLSAHLGSWVSGPRAQACLLCLCSPAGLSAAWCCPCSRCVVSWNASPERPAWVSGAAPGQGAPRTRVWVIAAPELPPCHSARGWLSVCVPFQNRVTHPGCPCPHVHCLHQAPWTKGFFS